MNDRKKQKKGIFYALLLIFLPPVGIFFLWKDKKYSNTVRILLSVFFGAIFIAALSPSNSDKDKIAPTAEGTVYDTRQTAAVDSVEPETEESQPKDIIESGEIKTERYTYQGQIKNGIPYGSGSFVLDDGSRVTGPVDGEAVTGQATCEYADGDVYNGAVKNNVPNGFGTYTTTDGDLIEGNWNNGILEGNARVIYQIGDVYEGETLNQKKSGQGKMKFANGDVYEGSWENDTYSGTGTYTFADSESYEGQWKEGLLDGPAIYRDGKGTVYHGVWTAGICQQIESIEQEAQ